MSRESMDLDLDFLLSEPQTLPYVNEGQLQRQPDKNNSLDIHHLASKIANVNDLVLQVKSLELQNQNLQHQLSELNKSAMNVKKLYEAEKCKADELSSQNMKLEANCKTAQRDLVNKTLHYEQSSAQSESTKERPMPYEDLCLKFLKVAKDLHAFRTLKRTDRDAVHDIQKYIVEQNIPRGTIRGSFIERHDLYDFSKRESSSGSEDASSAGKMKKSKARKKNKESEVLNRSEANAKKLAKVEMKSSAVQCELLLEKTTNLVETAVSEVQCEILTGNELFSSEVQCDIQSSQESYNSCSQESSSSSNFSCFDSPKKLPEVDATKGCETSSVGSLLDSPARSRTKQFIVNAYNGLPILDSPRELQSTETVFKSPVPQRKNVAQQTLPMSPPKLEKKTKSQGTQYISTTTTRGTCTSSFIKKHSVGINFPEVLPSYISDILKEMIVDIEPVSPIRELEAMTPAPTANTRPEMKTVGTCTDLKNVRMQVDYVPITVKKSDSRPPSRTMFERIKWEATANEPLSNDVPLSANGLSIPELWNLLGQTIFAFFRSGSTQIDQSQMNLLNHRMESLNQQLQREEIERTRAREAVQTVNPKSYFEHEAGDRSQNDNPIVSSSVQDEIYNSTSVGQRNSTSTSTPSSPQFILNNIFSNISSNLVNRVDSNSNSSDGSLRVREEYSNTTCLDSEPLRISMDNSSAPHTRKSKTVDTVDCGFGPEILPKCGEGCDVDTPFDTERDSEQSSDSHTNGLRESESELVRVQSSETRTMEEGIGEHHTQLSDKLDINEKLLEPTGLTEKSTTEQQPQKIDEPIALLPEKLVLYEKLADITSNTDASIKCMKKKKTKVGSKSSKRHSGYSLRNRKESGLTKEDTNEKSSPEKEVKAPEPDELSAVDEILKLFLNKPCSESKPKKSQGTLEVSSYAEAKALETGTSTNLVEQNSTFESYTGMETEEKEIGRQTRSRKRTLSKRDSKGSEDSQCERRSSARIRAKIQPEPFETEGPKMSRKHLNASKRQRIQSLFGSDDESDSDDQSAPSPLRSSEANCFDESKTLKTPKNITRLSSTANTSDEAYPEGTPFLSRLLTKSVENLVEDFLIENSNEENRQDDQMQTFLDKILDERKLMSPLTKTPKSYRCRELSQSPEISDLKRRRILSEEGRNSDNCDSSENSNKENEQQTAQRESCDSSCTTPEPGLMIVEDDFEEVSEDNSLQDEPNFKENLEEDIPLRQLTFGEKLREASNKIQDLQSSGIPTAESNRENSCERNKTPSPLFFCITEADRTDSPASPSPPPIDETIDKSADPVIIPADRIDHCTKQRNINCGSIVTRLIRNYNEKYRKIVVNSHTNIDEHTVNRIKDSVQYYTKSSDANSADVSKTRQLILAKSQDPTIISRGILRAVKALEKEEIDCTVPTKAPKMTKSVRKIFVLIRGFSENFPDIHTLVLNLIERDLFTLNSSLQVEALRHYTQLYVALTDLHCRHKNPVRLFIANCLYFYNLKAIPMIYHVLLAYPSVLPRQDDPSYDRSDALINVIQCILNNTFYNFDSVDLYSKQLFMLLRNYYKYEAMKPNKQDLIENLAAKIRAGKLKNVSYAFALVCKRQEQSWVVSNVLQKLLIPLASELHSSTECSENDEKVACLLESISFVIKPFPAETDVSFYLNIFERFLNSTKRKIIQEAAVCAILRTARFGYVNCFNLICDYDPEYELEATTKAQIKSFLYRKNLPFLRQIERQAKIYMTGR